MANVGAGSLARRERLVGMLFVDSVRTCSTRRRGGSVAGNVPLVGALLASLRWLLRRLCCRRERADCSDSRGSVRKVLLWEGCVKAPSE